MSVKCAARCNDFAASIDDRLAATQHLPKIAYKSQWSGEWRVWSVECGVWSVEWDRREGRAGERCYFRFCYVFAALEEAVKKR